MMADFPVYQRACRICGTLYDTTLPAEVFEKKPDRDLCWPCTTRRIEASRDNLEADHA